MNLVTIDDIHAAAKQVAGVAVRTPLLPRGGVAIVSGGNLDPKTLVDLLSE